MIRKITIISCFWGLFVIPVFAQQVIKTDTSHFSTIRIDPANSAGGNVSDIFEKVNYIPLETTPESLFGSINQLEVLNNYYVILDYNTNAILIFNLNGKFHAKIKGRSNAHIYKFLINRWTNQIVYTADNYQNMTYCDLDGKVIKTEKDIDPKGTPIIYLNSYFISPDQLISYDQYRDLDTLSKYYQPYSRSLLRFGKTVHSIGMPYTKAETKIDVVSSGIGPLTTFGNDTVFFFAKPYDYTLYTVTPHAIKLTYKFVFPQQYALPSNFVSNPVYDLKRIAYIQKNKDLIFSLNNCYQVGNNLLFEASTYGSSQEDNLVYNLKSGNLIAYKHILPDEASWFLPIYDKVSSNFDNVGLAPCDGTFVYTSLSSLCLFKANEENKDKNVKLPVGLAIYFTKGSTKDNPVILQLKLKDSL
ncbi:6-bladed beta-propeller [Mucilaginibacter sp.]|uniref:6-bladed beta-propeller n=1 Tax=Mucilaginibacter sp. TaxID=1882438 RepID=UPI002ED0DDD7